jgi:hypothetical protein
VNLKRVNYDVEYEGERDSPVRMVIWTLSFTAKGFVYGPVTQSAVIKQAITNISNMNSVGPEGTVQLNMANTGFGFYKTGEVVYQGFDLEAAIATATVVSYSNTTNILVVNKINGVFQSNTLVIGTNSNAEYILNSPTYPNQIMSVITQTVSPNTANVNSNYTVITSIKEPGGF